MKILKLGPKVSYLGILKLKFEKTIFIFEISTIDLVKMLRFVEKKKFSNLGPRMLYLGIFRL